MKTSNICGYTTKSGPCQNRVKRPGVQCHIHRASLSPKYIVSRVLATCEKVVLVHGSVQAAQWLFDHVWPLARDLAGLLMPENFWYNGLGRGDRAEMLSQLQLAKKNKNRFVEKVGKWSDEDRAEVVAMFDRLDKMLSDYEGKEIRRIPPNPATTADV